MTTQTLCPAGSGQPPRKPPLTRVIVADPGDDEPDTQAIPTFDPEDDDDWGCAILGPEGQDNGWANPISGKDDDDEEEEGGGWRIPIYGGDEPEGDWEWYMRRGREDEEDSPLLV